MGGGGAGGADAAEAGGDGESGGGGLDENEVEVWTDPVPAAREWLSTDNPSDAMVGGYCPQVCMCMCVCVIVVKAGGGMGRVY